MTEKRGRERERDIILPLMKKKGRFLANGFSKAADWGTLLGWGGRDFFNFTELPLIFRSPWFRGGGRELLIYPLCIVK